MSQPEWVPERGDIVWLNFDPQAGHEQSGRRPAVVLSTSTYNRLFDLAIVVPVTSRQKGYLWEYPLPEGLEISGIVLTDQVRNLDWRQRNAQLATRIPPQFMPQILGFVRRLLE